MDLAISKDKKVVVSHEPFMCRVFCLDPSGHKIISKKLEKLSYVPEIISPYFKLLDLQTIKSVQNKGYQIIPWTVNKEEDLQRMISFNVDGIITDYPDKLMSLVS